MFFIVAANLHFSATVHEGSPFSTSLPTLTCCLFDDNHSDTSLMLPCTCYCFQKFFLVVNFWGET